MRLFAELLGCIFLAGTLLAQNSTGPSLGPDGDTRVSISGIKILPIAGKPFSGSDSIDWTRTLEDGSVVATHQDAKLARDGQGRIYRENVTRFPANSDQKSKVKEIIILDPVANTRTACLIAARQCDVTDYHGAASSVRQPAGPFDDGKRNLSRETLGTDTIQGLNVVGTRETLTINAGAEGNSQPLSSTEEFWYSPDLEVNLSVTRKDPREGTLVIHVVDVSRSEPDPSLFQVPANFAVEDHRRSTKAGN
jgi:hypothetical protein